jgi:rhodanese-related sulfurtransferase
MTIASIAPDDLSSRQASGKPVDLIDVRSPGEYAGVHIPGARNTPLDRFDAAAVHAAHDSEAGPLYVVCQAGPRAATAAAKLQEAGATDVVLVEGGTAAWQRAGLPVIKGKGVIPVDRQLQIVIGVLVGTGGFLAWFVNPAWALLPAVVGLGLLNAGITGICPMGMLIAAMPWNRGGASCALPKAEQA